MNEYKTPQQIEAERINDENRRGEFGPLCGDCGHGQMCHAAAVVNGPRTGPCYGLGRTLQPNQNCQCKALRVAVLA